MFTLKHFQQQAVQELIRFTLDGLCLPESRFPILLKAPTGAGKTVIVSHYVSELLKERENIAFIWIAPNTLHLQSYQQFQNWFAHQKGLRCLELDCLGTNPVLHPKDILFINWSKVSSQKNVWRQSNERNMSIDSLIHKTKSYGTDIVLIIDEAHLSALTGTMS